MKWFFKVTFFRASETIRERVKLSEALFYVLSLPMHEWANIRSITIERLH